MANGTNPASAAGATLRAAQVYAMAGICLAAGLGIGYLLRDSRPGASPAPAAASATTAPGAAGATGAQPMPSMAEMQQMAARQGQGAGSAMPAGHPGGAKGGQRVPTMADMKQIADKQAAPLLEKLKSDPNNSAVLAQVGGIYHSTHQFKEAVAYYDKAVQLDPKNVALRTKLATSLFRNGDVDGAIAQLNKALTDNPGDANALFDLGMIRLQGKQDGKGAVAAWQQLLKLNPQLSEDRKAQVQKLMADVLTTLGDQHQTEGARSK